MLTLMLLYHAHVRLQQRLSDLFSSSCRSSLYKRFFLAQQLLVYTSIHKLGS